MKPIFPKPATSSCQIERSRDRHIKRSQDCHIERSRDRHIERSRDSFSLAFDFAQGDISGITNFFEPLICHIELACAELSRNIETLSYQA